jgi:hypothetical protein
MRASSACVRRLEEEDWVGFAKLEKLFSRQI